MCWDGNGWMWAHGWGGGWLMAVLTLTLFFALVVAGIAVTTRYLKPGGSQNGARLSTATAAEDVLAHRFARGEIDETEFRQRISALKEHR